MAPLESTLFNFSLKSKESKKLSSDSIKILEEIMKNKNNQDSPLSFLGLPENKSLIEKTKELVEKKQELHPECILVIGIGGSNLGTMALKDALLGSLYNYLVMPRKILFLDSLEPGYLNDLLSIIENLLRAKSRILINIVTKSGNTIETAGNAEVVIGLLKKYIKRYKKFIVVTTEKDNKLWNKCLSEGIDLLEIPKKISGRFSVFSPVGLFPLGMLGIDLGELLKGAKESNKDALNSSVEKNLPLSSAVLHYSLYKKKHNIAENLFFVRDFESIGKWNRQLIAESLGKNSKGITPSYSTGPVDLHSMSQLYFEGPKDKIISLIRVKKPDAKITIPKKGNLFQESLIRGKKVDSITDALIDGTKNVLSNKKTPFIEIKLKERSERALGFYFQSKMIETVLIGKFMNVNPFDQPSVELYKKEARDIILDGK